MSRSAPPSAPPSARTSPPPEGSPGVGSVAPPAVLPEPAGPVVAPTSPTVSVEAAAPSPASHGPADPFAEAFAAAAAASAARVAKAQAERAARASAIRAARAAAAARAAERASVAVYPKRQGYRHGYLEEAAVKRGLEVIAARGPAGLTLRGIARDLGVTPGAICHRFGNLEGLRQAVADEIAARMAPHTRMNAGPSERGPVLVQNGAAWVRFAAENPHWYAFAAGVAWRRRPPGKRGAGSWFSPAFACLRTTRRSVEGAWQGSPHRVTEGNPDLAVRSREVATRVYAGIHGLAMATADGLAPREHALPFLVALAATAG